MVASRSSGVRPMADRTVLAVTAAVGSAMWMRGAWRGAPAPSSGRAPGGRPRGGRVRYASGSPARLNVQIADGLDWLINMRPEHLLDGVQRRWFVAFETADNFSPPVLDDE